MSDIFSLSPRINPTDLILVNRSGISYKVPAAQMQDRGLPTDLLLVNRAGVSYKMPWGSIDNALDTDLILISHDGTSYQGWYHSPLP